VPSSARVLPRYSAGAFAMAQFVPSGAKGLPLGRPTLGAAGAVPAAATLAAGPDAAAVPLVPGVGLSFVGGVGAGVSLRRPPPRPA